MEERLSTEGLSTFFREDIKVVDNITATLLFSINQQMLQDLTKEQKEALGKEVQAVLDKYKEIAKRDNV